MRTPTIDLPLAATVLIDGELKRFHGFWTPAGKAKQLAPAAGCSVPMFHGSAAVLAALLVWPTNRYERFKAEPEASGI